MSPERIGKQQGVKAIPKTLKRFIVDSLAILTRWVHETSAILELLVTCPMLLWTIVAE